MVSDQPEAKPIQCLYIALLSQNGRSSISLSGMPSLRCSLSFLILLREIDRIVNRGESKNRRTNSFFDIIKRRNLQAASIILLEGFDVNVKDKELGNTVLIHAVNTGSSNMVSFLLEKWSRSTIDKQG
jgi:hypothetical protein